MEGDFLDIAQAAQELGLGQSTVWLLLKRTDIPRFRIPGEGKKTFIRREDLPRLKQPVPITDRRRAGKTRAAA